MADPGFVTAVNSRGDKQRIPAHYLDHPVLGKGFKLPPKAQRSTVDAAQAASENAEPEPATGDAKKK